MAIPTPHIQAKEGEIAKTVLMPGDPLRAKFIADNFLTDVKQYNFTRNMFGFTGKYNGKEISVQGSGMGIPSIAIYSYELYSFYGIENIIRIGSAGAYADDLDLGDILFASGASTDSNFMEQYNLPGTFAPIADFSLLRKGIESAEKLGIKYKVGNVVSTDAFYHDRPDCNDKWKSMGVLAVEMEAAGLYCNAAKLGKKALCMLTVSDHIYKGTALSADDREKTFTDMMKIALEFADN